MKIPGPNLIRTYSLSTLILNIEKEAKMTMIRINAKKPKLMTTSAVANIVKLLV